MKHWSKFLFLLVFGLSFLVFVARLATGATASPLSGGQANSGSLYLLESLAYQGPPEGFEPAASRSGVQLYRKDYPKGNPDFVQVADLSQGAALKLMQGDIMAPGMGRGVYGGDNPRFQRLSLKGFWQKSSSPDNDPFCVVNGGFFYLPDSPTRLAFPLKVNNTLLTDGYGINEYPDQKLMLEIWADHLDIRPMTPEALYASTAPDILGGLTEVANKKGKFALGRTFVGINDQDGNGLFETALLFSTLTSTQADAARVLRSFGASKVMMLDGGESTQLMCLNKTIIESERLIPQALAVMAANDRSPLKPLQRVENPPENENTEVIENAQGIENSQGVETTQGSENAPANENVLATSWPILVASEQGQVNVQIQNTSTEVWKAGQAELVIDNKSQGDEHRFPLQIDANPGDKVNFTWKTKPIQQSGVYTTEWFVTQAEKNLSGAPVLVKLIVIPQELKDRQVELQAAIADWSHQQKDTIEQNIRNWLQQAGVQVAPGDNVVGPSAQTTAASAPALYSLDDVFIIPLLILPFAGIILLIVLKVQRPSFTRVYSYEEIDQLPDAYEDESVW